MKRLRFATHWLLAVTTAGLLAAPGSLAAQATGQVTGSVTAEDGRPLSGASVSITGTDIGALTNATGRYSLPAVPSGQHTVQATLIGYGSASATVSVAAGQTATADLQLTSQALELEGIVAVGYGTQRKETLTGSVSAVSGEEIKDIPTTNVSNMLGGKLPGVVTVNSSGEPGYDGSSIRIRGNHTLNNNDPLIVIDGVPDRQGGLDRLNPQDIESISVLKDASAAIYGSRAANGVILVTTKRGGSGEPQLTASFNQGFNQPTQLPEMADAATYMTMLNEIDLYRNREPRYTENQIEQHRIGADPWLYPDTDWFDAVIKPLSLQSRGDVGLRGGSDRIQYYLSLDGLTEDGYYENSATRYNQYGVRSNIDGQISENLSVRFDVTGRLEDRNFPNRSANSIFRSLLRGKPNLPAYWPNGLPGPDIEYGDNPVVIATPATGYANDERYFVQGNLGLELKVPGITGLTIRSDASYDNRFQYQKSWRTPWTLYTWDGERDANGEPLLTPAPRGFSTPELYQRDDRRTDILLNLVANYQRDFGQHSIGLLGGAERQTADNSALDAFRKYFVSDQLDEMFAGGDAEKNNWGSAGVSARQNYFSRINYDYADKYLLELIGRYDGSYIFPEDGRYGFFPAVSGGWRISEEPFFQNVLPTFDELKLRASWGQTGNDRLDQWQYLATYGFGGGYVFGVDTEVKSIFQTRTPNPDVTWEVANQFDVGLEGALLDQRLSFEVDYFNYLRSDILWWRNASVPQTTGLSLPRENIGKVASSGFDGSIVWRQPLGSDISYSVSLNGGYAQNKIKFWDEAPGAPDWQKSTGSRMSTGLYYNAIGVFEDDAAVDAYPHWSGARPGDIIFEDIDGDGAITPDDRIRVNQNGDPTWTGGATLGAQVKNFDFTMFFVGAAGAVQYLETESGDIGNYMQDYAEKRWTPENPNAEHPRAYNRQDEYWVSNANTYFLRDADYLRLKTLEVGYRLPASLAPRLGVQDMRIYANGFNLLTWDKFELMDPESRNTEGRTYPQKRTLNVGASVTF
jgi:TonB-linked SusC/RagA family outer membrane protein